MPNKQPHKRFSLEGFDNAHYKRTMQYVSVVQRLYDQAIIELVDIVMKANIDNKEKPFSFDDYPKAKKLATDEIIRLSRNITATIQNGSREEWLNACKKNDAFINSILDTSKVDKSDLERMQDNNLNALKSFQNRKINGLNLSQRVWKYTEQFKQQIELGIDVGIGEGRSAQQLSRDLRQNLRQPDRLFRRVRDKRGNLHLSKNAKAFNPGQGVYRSSAKNAERLTRTEINMAYREADHKRWQGLDFVVGFEIRVSNRHNRWLEEYWNKHNPGRIEICDRLAGKYPKWFKFVGWHPQCMCYCVPILMDDKTFRDNRVSRFKSALNGKEYDKYSSKNEIKDVPDAFKDWVKENENKQGGWRSSPYFVRDNFKNGKLSDGLLKLPIKETIEPKPIIKPISTISDNLPKKLYPKSDYLRKEDYTFDKDFFDLINRDDPIDLEITTKSGSYYNVYAKHVHIGNTQRYGNSSWYRKAAIYHEYGHAIDWQKDLRGSEEVKALRSSQIKKLRKKQNYKIWTREYSYDTNKYINVKSTQKMSRIAYIDAKIEALTSKIYNMKDETFEKYGISKYDVFEQIGAVRDTIKSLDIRYGIGHSDAYFKQGGMKEAEYIAHAFENTFIGNRVFEKYLPDIYAEMISYIRSLK